MRVVVRVAWGVRETVAVAVLELMGVGDAVDVTVGGRGVRVQDADGVLVGVPESDAVLERVGDGVAVMERVGVEDAVAVGVLEGDTVVERVGVWDAAIERVGVEDAVDVSDGGRGVRVRDAV